MRAVRRWAAAVGFVLSALVVVGGPSGAAPAGGEPSTNGSGQALQAATEPVQGHGSTVLIGDSVPCQDVVFVGARGSGEAADAATANMGEHTHLAFQEFVTALTNKPRTYRVGYWAATSHSPRPVSDLPDAPDRFIQGIDDGVAETLAFLTHRMDRCPSEHFVLAGYSQGAMVMHRVMWQLESTQRLAPLDGIVVIADGDRVPNQGGQAYGTSSRDVDARGVAFSGDPSSGTYGATRRDVPDVLSARFHSMCDRGDVVCDAGYDGPRQINGPYVHKRHYLKVDDVTAKVMRAVGRATGSRSPTPAMSITAPLRFTAAIGIPYDLALTTNQRGGRNGAAVVWTLAEGGLPPGFVLNTDGKSLRVDARLAGSFSFALRATDRNGQWVEGTFDVTVTPVGGGRAFVSKSVSVGHRHACALTTGGAVYCWGANSQGQLGNGTTTDAMTPVSVTGLTGGVTAIAANYNHTCAVTSEGGVLCWGENDYGQLGDGTTTGANEPVSVVGLRTGARAVATGPEHTCAVGRRGALSCWGRGHLGQLGAGSTASSTVPVPVTGLGRGVTAVATGDGHTCALAGGGALCWGGDYFGTLGNGTRVNSAVPISVPGLASGVDSITAGNFHTCAVKDDGRALCWGDNDSGQLGDNLATHVPGPYPANTSSAVPVPVTGLAAEVMQISGGLFHTCALTRGGAAFCWGRGTGGELGNGLMADSAIPVAVTGLAGGVRNIAAGWGRTSAVSSVGGILSWGFNFSGQLGNGNSTDWGVPVPLLGS